MSEIETPRRGAWPHVRGVLVAAHIVAVLILAIPDTGHGGVSRSAWKNPTVQAEFAAWTERLNSAGVDIEPAELESKAWVAANSWSASLNRIRAPFVPYKDYLGVRQRWRMFVGPHRNPKLLHVEIREAGSWRAVQIARSDQHDWRGHQFDHVRMRAVLFRYGWRKYARHYHRLTHWIGAQAAADFPDATVVRIRMYRFRTATPQEVKTDTKPDGVFEQEVVLDLEAFR